MDGEGADEDPALLRAEVPMEAGEEKGAQGEAKDR